MDIFSLGGVILDLLKTVVAFWNDKVSLVFELLGQSPTEDVYKRQTLLLVRRKGGISA